LGHADGAERRSGNEGAIAAGVPLEKRTVGLDVALLRAGTDGDIVVFHGSTIAKRGDRGRLVLGEYVRAATRPVARHGGSRRTGGDGGDDDACADCLVHLVEAWVSIT